MHHFDELGSTRLITDDYGNVTDTYACDAWGNVVNHTGTTQQPYRYVGELGYYTHHQDPNLDLLQLGVRFYEPEVGRFSQLDPIRDGLNWYGYVDSTPLAYVDPEGTYKYYSRLENVITKKRSSCSDWVRVLDPRGQFDKWVPGLFPDFHPSLWCKTCTTEHYVVTYKVLYEPCPTYTGGPPQPIVSRTKIYEGWFTSTVRIRCTVSNSKPAR